MKTLTKRKKIIILTVLLILIVLLIVIFLPKKGKFIYGTNVSDISSITVTDGSTGDITYIDQQDFEELMTAMNNITYYPNYFAPTSYGWAYNVVIKTETKTTSIHFLGESCTVNNIKYGYECDSDKSIIEILRELCN